MNKWTDGETYSCLKDDKGCEIANVVAIGTGGWLYRTLTPEQLGIHDAGIRPTLEYAKQAAEDALPKPKGLEWDGRMARLNGTTVGGTESYADGQAVFVNWTMHLSDSEARQVVEYAYSLKHGTPAAPALPLHRTPVDAAQHAAVQLNEAERDEFAAWFRLWHQAVTPAAPAAEAGAEQDHEWAKMQATIIRNSIKADREQRDAKLLERLGDFSWSATSLARIQELLAAIDAEAK